MVQCRLPHAPNFAYQGVPTAIPHPRSYRECHVDPPSFAPDVIPLTHPQTPSSERGEGTFADTFAPDSLAPHSHHTLGLGCVTTRRETHVRVPHPIDDESIYSTLNESSADTRRAASNAGDESSYSNDHALLPKTTFTRIVHMTNPRCRRKMTGLERPPI